ncbi:OPT oligopeptide transporter protein-domain-containing protein [Dactylonectria macrodidyma]|uniref:OPT oligopeptide transporter protein-domain-containing protein n=1 Tax=Dactylonectria macrodidyma TaxID=307937 RepID=A0A9P9FGX2_9HYPO|nr:OPT oligopeptide transporter protein-domain-containing protein [Dactylonectria macrodidyma]
MADVVKKIDAPESAGGVLEKEPLDTITSSSEPESGVQNDLNVTEDDLLEAKEIAATLSLEDVRKMMTQVYALHKRDPNFPLSIIEKIEVFIGNEAIFENPEKHEQIIHEMKIETALITNNSPYAEVRAVVDNHDDPTMPCSTIRAWVIGIFFSAAIAFVNGFFDIRQPSIYVTSNVPQLLAYPVGKLWERFLPDVGFTLFGVRHSLNPGPFNKKEHMLITIMASISKDVPYTNYVVWMQYLPTYFNQSWAINFGYQITIALSTNFIGYGLAGLCRRFLVYPSYCVWPASLVTIALNTAFHSDGNIPVLGPLKKVWTWSRLKFFTIAFTAMFFYFWLPNYLFYGLSWFSWMTWIAPDNVNLSVITGGYSGMGLNPFSTFDWNVFIYFLDPLMVPFFSTFNYFVGALITFFAVVAIFYGNAYNSAYIPVNDNHVWDHFGQRYNVTSILDERGIFDAEKYEAYSPPFLSAGNIVVYMLFFAVYTSAITYGILYHHREIRMGFRDLVNSFRPSKKGEVEQGQVLDVHNRLMKAYPEVPEWWYLIVLVCAVVLGVVGIAEYPTYTTPAVVPYGIALCLIFVVPVGIIRAMTGVEVTLNVLAEFIGGSWVEGNALAMCFFKTYGYVTCAQALSFSNDLKLAHYLKIPPRFTFWAQMVPTIVSTFVCVAIVQYQVHLEGVCTDDAPFRFFCPGINTFFTAAVLWGTVGPKKMWGIGGQYVETLIGFPLGFVVVVLFWWLGKKYPKNRLIRNTHPVVIFNGGLIWAPYNLTYIWPAVPVGWFSWVFLKKRYLGLWSKYNFVLSAAFSAGIAISALVIFFALQYSNIEVTWWGNTAPFDGCEGSGACVLKTLPDGEYFGPRIGDFH